MLLKCLAFTTLSCILFSACSMLQTSPKLVRWKGQQFVVCCDNRPDRFTHCGRDAWVETIRKHCVGSVKAISGDTQSKAVGMYMESMGSAYEGGWSSTNVSLLEKESQCVEYECSEKVKP